MQIDIVAIFLLLLFGCAAFVFGVLCLIGKSLAVIGRAVGRALFGDDVDDDRPRVHPYARPTRICPRRGCGKAEFRPARFCSQCGLRFPDDGV